ncbi:Protein cereblon [Merluccius polli]|uniref:Protein cereblon n=1 Tax=Merluccius polli TaxID=89951 RepID=A0AA47NS25_MERPO|nr:Protein cereblon [Merluccius polli]
MVSVCGSDMRGPSCPPWRVRPKPTVPWWWAVLLLWCCCTQTRSDACAAAEGDDGAALLLCRSCGHEVTTGADLNPVRSPLALSHRNDSRLGDEPLHVQVLQNPHGHRFEVITFKAADVAKRWPADGGSSWFPGFAWTVASCPRCGAHLGWGFQPSEWPLTVPESRFVDSERTFVALIAGRLLREDLAPRLLVPRSYSS